jgi:hypothetical protein
MQFRKEVPLKTKKPPFLGGFFAYLNLIVSLHVFEETNQTLDRADDFNPPDWHHQ